MWWRPRSAPPPSGGALPTRRRSCPSRGPPAANDPDSAHTTPRRSGGVRDAPPPVNVPIPAASVNELEACVDRPEGKAAHPAIVMSHGSAAAKDGGLQPFVE